MKYLLSILSLVLMFTFCIIEKSHASGELVAGAYYLDDYQGAPLSPKLGIKANSDGFGLLGKNWLVSSYLGGGYIAQQADMNGDTPTGVYGDLVESLSYQINPELSASLGGGIAFNKSVYKSFDDHVHIMVSYKLW